MTAPSLQISPHAQAHAAIKLSPGVLTLTFKTSSELLSACPAPYAGFRHFTRGTRIILTELTYLCPAI